MRNSYIIINSEELRKAYKTKNIKECAKFFNCSPETIKRRLIRIGIKIKTKSEVLKAYYKTDKAIPERKRRSKRAKKNKIFQHYKGSGIGLPKNVKGKKNPNWRGGNSPKYWTQRVIAHYGDKCDICKWDNVPELLEVHHKDYNRKNNTIENGQVLCPTCHRIIHFKERGFK